MTETQEIIPSAWGRRRRILAEVLLVYGATVGLMKLLYELKFVPVIQEYLWTVVMLLQIYVPAWWLHRRQQTVAHFGLHFRRWNRNVLWFLGISLLCLPPSILGHHLWQRYQSNVLRPYAQPYLQFSPKLRGDPGVARSAETVQIYAPSPRAEVVIRWRAPIEGVLRSDAPLQVIDGSHWIRGDTRGKAIRFSGGGGNTPISIRVRLNGKGLHFKMWRDGRVLPYRVVKLGAQRASTDSGSLFRGWGWIFHIILAQVFMVALPEEFFYRGYMQTRIDAVSPPTYWRGIPLSWGNVLVSALFALTHFLIGHQVYRLSVFFPSLVFGALRQRTGSLLAPILFHATSNILMKFLEVWYL